MGVVQMRNVLLSLGLAATLALVACKKPEEAAPAPEAAAPVAEQQAADAAAAPVEAAT
ncbi:UNVERIFIED_CONTAM: hypothetical protein IGO34_24650, partial [Salmonella enterica subsp. enterica serovar Weltevreden]